MPTERGFHSLSEERRIRLSLEALSDTDLRRAIQRAPLPIRELARDVLHERAEAEARGEREPSE